MPAVRRGIACSEAMEAMRTGSAAVVISCVAKCVCSRLEGVSR